MWTHDEAFSFTHQIQHGLDDVPVADLADLDEADQHGELHADVADRNRGVDDASRQNHGARAGHHRIPAARGFSLRQRRRKRLLARHFQPKSRK